MPTVKELATLVDYSVPYGHLMMDATVFVGEPASWLWSSTPVAGGSIYALSVNFGTGVVVSNWVDGNFYARCVACSVPPSTGLLAAWNQAGGTYADATNQTGRYSASNGIVTDTLTGIQWQQNASTSVMNFTDASAYCANQTTGGLSGWRLPNNAELMSLVDYTVNYVGAIPGINAVFNNTPTNYFYSSTPLTGSATHQPWWMSFGQDACYSGLLYSLEYSPGCTPAVANQGYARCVRSCYPTPPISRYITTSDIATDSITGLTWQRVSTGVTMNQTAAVSYCSGLSLPSFSSGWRLPSVRELSTLVEYSVSSGQLMMDSKVFLGEPANWFWSSTPLVGDPTDAWVVNFLGGDTSGDIVANLNAVRCVR